MDVDFFIKAARDGNLQKIKEYINGGGDVNIKHVVVS